MSTADVIYARWRHFTNGNSFANTLELKMLLRMSNNTGAVAAYRDAKLS
jgi:hypothetical protein